MGTPDGFGRRLSGNLAHTLARMLIGELGCNARSEKPGLLGRSSMAFVSQTDWREAYLCGQAAVCAAVEGATDKLVSLIREPGPEYLVKTGLAPLADAAGTERLFPLEWITADGADVAPEFLEYAAPLLGPMQSHARL
jgi:6-phosphofructokinase 1